MILQLNEMNLLEAAQWLALQDAGLAMVLEKYWPPPLWSREAGFATLIHIILEQQVSLSSANAAFQKLKANVDVLTPDSLLALTDETLRNAGLSRQKMLYCRNLAQEVQSGRFDFKHLHHLPDADVSVYLKRLKGIGDWTADVYLSECLLRPDILPKGDIAMQEAFKVLKGLSQRPVHEDFMAGTEHWRPWRSVGTRMLWHYYLCERGRKM